MGTTRIVHVYLRGRLSRGELLCLRGAVNKTLRETNGGYENNVLFHNHEATGLKYGYPLVQFRRTTAGAVIVGIGEAATTVSSLAEKHEPKLTIGSRETLLTVEKCEDTYYQPPASREHVQECQSHRPEQCHHQPLLGIHARGFPHRKSSEL